MEGSFKRDMVGNAFNTMKSLPLPFKSNALHGKAATTLKLERKSPPTASYFTTYMLGRMRTSVE